MGILSSLFGGGGQTETAGPPPPVQGNSHSFVAENDHKDPAPYLSVAGLGNGIAGWAPNQRAYRASDNFNPGLNLAPPGGREADEWYVERNEQNLVRGQVEGLDGTAWPVTQYENSELLNPWIQQGPPKNFRVTESLSPSTYRFEVGNGRENGPIGLRNQTHLNGNHFSSASNNRTYASNGMLPASHFRNTYRAVPPSIGNPGLTDYSGAEGTYVYPADTVVDSPRTIAPSRSFRL
jgi:hypothetical protein